MATTGITLALIHLGVTLPGEWTLSFHWHLLLQQPAFIDCYTTTRA